MSIKPKLRLLITDKCNRKCEGCCNNDWDLESLPVLSESEFKNYSTIMLTGGEPFLNTDNVIDISIISRMYGFTGMMYLYTAMTQPPSKILSTLHFIDGLTLTLHNSTDVFGFYDMNARLKYVPGIQNKSLRLNVFKGINLIDFDYMNMWKIKSDIEWIKNCPLPDGEEFKRFYLQQA